jgi:hypothetical protein
MQQLNPHFGTRIVSGGALIIAGALLTAQQAGYLQSIALNRSWPLIIVLAALVQLARTMNAPRQRGWALLLMGDWLFANSMTDWTYAQFTWPILLAGVGTAMIVRAVSQRHPIDHEEIRGNHYAT